MIMIIRIIIIIVAHMMSLRDSYFLLLFKLLTEAVKHFGFIFIFCILFIDIDDDGSNNHFYYCLCVCTLLNE